MVRQGSIQDEDLLHIPSKNNYYEIFMLTTKKVPMKTAEQKHSANSDGSVLSLGPPFSLVNALVYVEHRERPRRSWPSVFCAVVFMGTFFSLSMKIS